MMLDLIRFAHVAGATVLLGTGAGIAFFMVMAHRSADPRLIAGTAGIVVVADTAFTATAAIAQPITGYLLARAHGWPLTEGWVAWSLALYVFVGAFWLPVVFIQIRMRNLARSAVNRGGELPEQYHMLYRIWFACGIPAFLAVLAILWLMLFRPM